MITSYEALDLGRFMKIDHILRTPAEEIDKQVQIVAILADMTEAEVLSLPLSDYSAMAAKIGFLGTLCAPADVDGSPITAGEFTLIPVRDFTKINTAQYVDFQTLVKDYPSTIPQLLSCFLVPEGKQYNEGYDIGAVQEAVLSLPLATAIGLTAFFFQFVQRINQGYARLFGTEDEGPEDEGGDSEDRDEGGDGFTRDWGWIANVDQASETLRCSWDEVWAKPAVEFLNVLAYRKDRQRYEKDYIERWKRSH